MIPAAIKHGHAFFFPESVGEVAFPPDVAQMVEVQKPWSTTRKSLARRQLLCFVRKQQHTEEFHCKGNKGRKTEEHTMSDIETKAATKKMCGGCANSRFAISFCLLSALPCHYHHVANQQPSPCSLCRSSYTTEPPSPYGVKGNSDKKQKKFFQLARVLIFLAHDLRDSLPTLQTFTSRINSQPALPYIRRSFAKVRLVFVILFVHL